MSCICRREGSVVLVTARKIPIGESCWTKIVKGLLSWNERTPKREFRKAAGLVRSG